MRLIVMTVFIVTRLGHPTAARPISSWNDSGIAVPLAGHPSFPASYESIDLDAISSNGVFTREKILRGFDNYERNTGEKHPFSLKSSDSGLQGRFEGHRLPLTTYRNTFWAGEISIGTPAKTFNVHIDTGSCDLWLLGRDCVKIHENRNFWDPSSSTSAEYMDNSFRIPFADGDIAEGMEYTDNVTIAGYMADIQTLGSVTSYISEIYNNAFPVDGMLGLAFSSISDFHTGSGLFETLVNGNEVFNPTFSLKLAPSGAELYIGGANSLLYNGDIAYTRVIAKGYWQVQMDDLRVHDDIILENIPIILDTGSKYIYGDWDQVSKLYDRLGGTLVVHESFGYYYMPCKSFPTLSLTFGGRSFEILPEVLKQEPIREGSSKCFSGIAAERNPVAYWTIGLVFLQGVYTIFDYSALQVGFAKLA